MKKLIALLLASLMVFALAACGGSAPAQTSAAAPAAEAAPEPTPEPTPEPAQLLPLEVEEFGWSLNNDYLYYSFIFKNPNESACILFPQFRVTARDADGVLLGSTEQTLNIAYPGQRGAYGFMGFKVDAAPAEVTIEYLEPKDYNVKDVSLVEHPDYKPLEVVNYALRDKKIVGEVKSENDYEISTAAVSILFRDADGKLLAGTSCFVDNVGNGLTPFETSVYEAFATENFEIWAQPWL